MNVMQRAAAIGRLQEMAEWLPDGSFNKTAVNAAVGDMMLQIPGAVKFGGGAWRCFQCGAEVQPLREADKAAKLQRATKGDDPDESAQETAGERLP